MVIYALCATPLALMLTAVNVDYAAAPPCDHETVMRDMLDRLGEDHDDWSLEDLEDVWGRAYPGSHEAEISEHMKCTYVPDVVLHEWAHLQQYRSGAEYDWQPGKERVADCVAQMLGSNHTPYLDPHDESYVGTCRPVDIAEAQELAADAPSYLHRE